jgi:hypothetical protein
LNFGRFTREVEGVENVGGFVAFIAHSPRKGDPQTPQGGLNAYPAKNMRYQKKVEVLTSRCCQRKCTHSIFEGYPLAKQRGGQGLSSCGIERLCGFFEMI